MEPLTHAQQNRLIVDHMALVERIAAAYRGQKGIPFDELAAEGRVGLVLAARSFNKALSQFQTWASHKIHSSIQDFIRNWEAHETAGLLNAEGDERYYEWSIYRTPYENWDKLAASPEQLKIAWEELAHTRNALSGALIGLSKRDRAIIEARFLRDPPQKLESIAREHKISYARVIFLVNRALKKLKKAISGQLRRLDNDSGERQVPG